MALLEREPQLAALRAAWQAAQAGQGQIALVCGEAGIGKTALVSTFAQENRTGVRWLWGACDALFAPRPLGPLYELAQQGAPDLLPLLQTDADWLAVATALLAGLQRSSSHSVVVVEDVHWADEATLDLLKYLGRRIQRTAVLLILTYRDDELGAQHPLRTVLGDLATSNTLRRIPLPALTEAAVRALAAGKAVDAAALHRQTDGNSFFVTEVLAEGALGLPATVREAVLARAARLSLSARAVLEAAAVIGRRIEPQLLSEVTRAEYTASEDCIAAGMLHAEGPMLAFRHDLARQAILESISPQRSLALHRRVLAAMRAAPAAQGDLARLAYHAEAAGDRAAVLEYAPAAARQAVAAHAHRQAAAQYARALRFAEALPPAERAVLLEDYAQECNLTDQLADGIAAQQEALAIRQATGDRLKQGAGQLLLVALHFGLGHNAEAEQSSRAAIDVLATLPASRELALAYRSQAHLRMLHRDRAEAVAWGEKAIALAERFDDAEARAAAYETVGTAWLMHDVERGRPYLERSLALARQAGLQVRIASALTNLGSGLGEVYQYPLASRYLAEGIAFTTEHDLDSTRLYMLAWQALAHLHLGRWDEAAEAAATVLAHPTIAIISRIMALLARGRLRARRGDPGVWADLDEALALAEQTQTLQRIAPVRAARAEAAWLAGDHERAVKEASAAYALALDKQHPWFTAELAYWRWQAGDTLEVPEWARCPFALHMAGEWRAAADAWAQLGCVYEQALALAQGDEAARRTALDRLERLGARPALKAVRQARPATSARRSEKDLFSGLSRREQETAVLIAQGLSNREIAQAMTVDVRTVETYVTRILGKLDFESRVQIATWVVQKGLETEFHARSKLA
jgi:DNA-binding CsgD family transcriptional regulator